MKALYVARGVLDYRVPVLLELDRALEGGLELLYSADYVPERVANKLREALGERAIGLRGELRIGANARDYHGFANRTLRLVFQPGLIGEIRRRSPDVLIGDGFFQWTSFALVPRFRYGTPLVVCYERTAHTDRNVQWYRRSYRRRVLPLVDAMACNGRLSREYAVSIGMASDRVTVGQMAADSQALAAASGLIREERRYELRRGWGSPELVFLAVGKINRPKGVWELIRAFEASGDRDSSKRALVFVGDGPERHPMQAYVQRASLSNVYLEGAVDYDRIAELYAAADLLVMPSLEDNWSLVLPEAMACGLPVLCSIYNGCYPELVAENVNGWTFDPLNPESAAQSLRRAWIERHRLPAMGDASRRIERGFQPSHAAKAIHDACRIAVGNVSRRDRP